MIALGISGMAVAVAAPRLGLPVASSAAIADSPKEVIDQVAAVLILESWLAQGAVS